MKQPPIALLFAGLVVLACQPSVHSDEDAPCDSSGAADEQGDGPGDAGSGSFTVGTAADDSATLTQGEGSVTASDDGDGTDDGDPTGGPPPADGTQVASGEHFVDAFFTDGGLVVVHAGGAELLARDGALLHGYESPRTITAADWEDDLLVLADAAMFTTLDGDFATLGSGTLTEGCLGAEIVSGARFVCGPENDWDRILYTYDAIGGTQLATSMPYTYNGIPMRGVPGLDEFITVTHDLSPSDFHLYSVDPTSDVTVYVNESPYHGDFPVRLGYAFAGDPATHVITEEGNMLLIHGDGCTVGSNAASCFVKDGELGTLPQGATAYGDLREAADGTVYGLVGGDGFYPEPPCVSGCTLQHIDVAQRTVIAEATISTSRELNFLRPDPAGGGVVVISAAEAPFHYAYDETEGAFEAHYYGL